MLLYKKIDFTVQVVLLVFIPISLIHISVATLFGLFILSGVQLISMIIHWRFPSHYRLNTFRLVYYYFVTIAAILFYFFFIAGFGDVGTFIFYTIGTYLVGVYYAVGCKKEINRITRLGVSGNH